MAPAAAFAAEVATLNRTEPYKDATVLSITAQEVKIRVEGKEEVLPSAQVLEIDLHHEPAVPIDPAASFLLVRLMDGTMLRCNAFGVKGKKVQAKLFNGVTLEFEARHLHYLLCEAQDPQNHSEFMEELAKHRSTNSTQDVLRVLNPQKTATLTFRGFVGDADEKGETIEFKLDRDTTHNVSLTRVRGIIFSRKPLQEPAAIARVVDQYHNTFIVHQLTMNESELSLATPTGLTQLPDNRPLTLPRSFASLIDFSLGKLVYLSDLDPLLVRETPREESPLSPGRSWWRYQRNRNLNGDSLRLDGQVYKKGLSLHSRTVIDFEVKGYNEFRCLVGIEDSITEYALAQVTIEGDGKILFQENVQTTDEKRKTKARELRLNIAGVDRLRLIVDYGDQEDTGDHVSFANARITK
jgi:hypothetical protein